MRTNILWPAALVLALLGDCAARAQAPPGQVPAPPGTDLGGPEELAPQGVYGGIGGGRSTATGATPPEGLRAPVGLSNWITYTCPECCGPIGGCGPLGYEVYLRSGTSISVGGGRLNRTLQDGWLIDGGARTLFFNPAADAAWTVDFGISTTENNINHPEVSFKLNNDLVTGRRLNRTGVNVGLGREWYLCGSAWDGGKNWRVGFDAGGRWERARLDLNDNTVANGQVTANGFIRVGDVVGGIFAAVHSDVEWPLGGCKLQAGVRIEWDYTWQDLLPPVLTDVEDVNFLLTIGVRF